MPSRNSAKTYVENGYYHVYNRGVEKRTIFLDQQDYAVFLSYLKEYLLPKNEQEMIQRLSDPNVSSQQKSQIANLLRRNNFNKEITLLAYCLMPNHFHLFLKQKSSGAIDKFMNSLGTRYTMYFNRKFDRVGSLYQDVYKAALIQNDEHFLHLSRYIHQQAVEFSEDQPCSLPEYLGLRKTSWINPGEVLSHFSKTNPHLSYENFVLEKDGNGNLGKLTLEDIQPHRGTPYKASPCEAEWQKE